MLIDRLDSEPDVTIRSALVTALGEFSATQLPIDQRQPIINKLLAIYEHEPDSGLHGAAEWLLRQWGQHTQLQAVAQKVRSSEQQLQSHEASDNRQWYINGHGQTFAIIDAGEFVMGSAKVETLRDTREHTHRIERRFAIATTEVTGRAALKGLSTVLPDPSFVKADECPQRSLLGSRRPSTATGSANRKAFPRPNGAIHQTTKGNTVRA